MLFEISPADIVRLPLTLIPVPVAPEIFAVPERATAPEALSVTVAEIVPPAIFNVPFEPIVTGCLIVPPSMLNVAIEVLVPTETNVVVFAIVELSIFALPVIANVPPLITNVFVPAKSNVVLPLSVSAPLVSVNPPLANFIGLPEILAPVRTDCEAVVN